MNLRKNEFEKTYLMNGSTYDRRIEPNREITILSSNL